MQWSVKVVNVGPVCSPKLWAAMVANIVERYRRLEIVEKMSGVEVQVACATLFTRSRISVGGNMYKTSPKLWDLGGGGVSLLGI